jgi:FixJ family two-component response regulator
MSRVLVVDNDVGTRETVGALLTDAGFDVTTAATGASALGLARQFSFGTILLDFRLPDLSGTDVLRHLRQSGVQTPVVIVTGFGSVPLAVEAMRYGALDVVQKPVIGDDLIHLVSNHVKVPPGLIS